MFIINRLCNSLYKNIIKKMTKKMIKEIWKKRAQGPSKRRQEIERHFIHFYFFSVKCEAENHTQ